MSFQWTCLILLSAILGQIYTTESWANLQGVSELMEPEYDFPSSPEYEPLGCYADRSYPRALNHLYYNARQQIDWDAWPDMSHVIGICAAQARKRGLKIFAVQHYGECWGEHGNEVNTGYDVYGESGDCISGVGQELTNFVYKLVTAEYCYFNGRRYREGDTMKVPSSHADHVQTICQQCTCYDGKPINCKPLYHCHLGLNGCEKYAMVRGKCCPVCQCVHAGKRMAEGQRWVWRERDVCYTCICLEGEAVCRKNQVICTRGECANPFYVEDECCPQCGTPTTKETIVIIPTASEGPPLTLPPPPREIRKRQMLYWFAIQSRKSGPKKSRKSKKSYY